LSHFLFLLGVGGCGTLHHLAGIHPSANLKVIRQTPRPVISNQVYVRNPVLITDLLVTGY
jgi:hypothetical protein